MIEESILRSIEASFDASKLVEAFSSVMKIVKAQNEEICGLREQLQLVDHKFCNLEDYLHTLSDKTYGEQLDIKPYGDCPRSALPTPKPQLAAHETEGLVQDESDATPTAISAKSSKSKTFSMKPLNFASTPKSIDGSYTADNFRQDEYQAENEVNTARSGYPTSAREGILSQLASPEAIAATNEFQAIVRSVIDKPVEIPKKGRELFDLSNLVLTMESDSLETILKDPQILSNVKSPSFLSNIAIKMVEASSASHTPGTISPPQLKSPPPQMKTPSTVNTSVGSFLESPKPQNLTVSLIQDAVIDTIEEGEAEDDSPLAKDDAKDSGFDEDEDDEIPDMPNISTFEYTIVPTQAQLRKRSRINRVKRPSIESRRLMCIDRLSFLTKERVDNILRELRVRGHFLKAIHSMLTAKNKKDREKLVPLRKRITELESSIETIFETLEHQKRNLRSAIVFAANAANPTDTPITSFPPPLASPFVAPPMMSKDRSIHVAAFGKRDQSGFLSPSMSSPPPLEPPKMSRGHSMVVGNAAVVNNNEPQPIKLDVFGRLPNDIIQTIKLQLDELNINRPPPALLVEDIEAKPVIAVKPPSTPSSVDLQFVKDQIATMKAKMVTKQDLDDAVETFAHATASRSRRNSVSVEDMIPKMTRDQTQALIDEVRFALEKNITENAMTARKEQEELRQVLLSKLGYMQDDMKKLQSNMKIVVDELDLMNTKEGGDDNREGLTLRAQIKKMAGGLVMQNEKQIKDFKEVSISINICLSIMHHLICLYFHS
jgi:hypothetical protein